ncbi:uncharacterized protein BO95DRAFT_260673 [Aspergillus brunneoviolaceus CBS 621.78]|uniref:Uncharacterized protein n=1 Tax=Aspergillus brunneoviolaceus CBS 621.78 TaxID=1450534 RepID=A0ACD1FXB2_9EURO|nr:hypothetical protein BO95DRAFT_260673 [Aspergillus brunneoviolaceus CBS 621.78]RAH41599.1 hypothetical protein BO95DRAFT_260673 [Aspergillus brunneoviolaceus CBS 621.78]
MGGNAGKVISMVWLWYCSGGLMIGMYGVLILVKRKAQCYSLEYSSTTESSLTLSHLRTVGIPRREALTRSTSFWWVAAASRASSCGDAKRYISRSNLTYLSLHEGKNRPYFRNYYILTSSPSEKVWESPPNSIRKKP